MQMGITIFRSAKSDFRHPTENKFQSRANIMSVYENGVNGTVNEYENHMENVIL